MGEKNFKEFKFDPILYALAIDTEVSFILGGSNDQLSFARFKNAMFALSKNNPGKSVI